MSTVTPTKPVKLATLVRRNMWSLDPTTAFSSPVTLNYAKAVKVMKSRPATDPTSWTYQANIHGTYSAVPAGADWNQCQHATWYFLPWHRMYIWYFEKIVRAAIVEAGGNPAGWALPYWNYSDGAQPPANTLPLALRAAKLPDGSANPLLLPYPHRNGNTQTDKQQGLGLIGAGINDGGQVPPTYTSYTQAFNFTNFTFPPGSSPGFGGPQTGSHHDGGADGIPFGELENQPHNIMHVMIGGHGAANCGAGTMTDPNCAAQDPVFWLHHSNIDRLWNRWIAKGHVNPTQSAWLTKSYKFYDVDTHAFKTIKVQDVLHCVSQLHYRYDDDPVIVVKPIPKFAALSRAAGGVEEDAVTPEPKVLASTGPVSFSSHASSVSAQMEPQKVRALADTALSPDNEGEINLRIEGVERDDDAGLLYDVYLNLPDDAKPDPESPYFVGHMPFFGHKHEHAEGSDHPTGMSFSYRITPLVNAQKTMGIWSDDNFKVTMAIGGHKEPDEVHSVADAARAPMGAAPGTVHVGSVRMTVE